MNKNKEKKIKNKIKKEANISIMVILILVACWIIWLLSLHFVRQIVQYNRTVLSYYKSYYISRAGLELSLTQIRNRGVGFQYKIQSDDDIIADNFLCYPNCSLTTEIIWQSKHLNKTFWKGSGCTKENSFLLASWQSLVVPLFKDSYFLRNYADVFSPIAYQSIFSNANPELYYHKLITSDYLPSNSISIWFVTSGYITLSKKYTGIDFSDNIIDTFLFDEKFSPIELEKIPRRRKENSYIILSNPSTDDEYLQFCLEVDRKLWSSSNYSLATDTAYISSLGTFGTRSLWLEAKYTHSVLPNFLTHGHIGL